MKRLVVSIAAATCLIAAQAPERLDRGMVALKTAEGKVYLGWRLLASDPTAAGFNVYRSSAGGKEVRLNRTPIVASTNCVDESAPPDRENAWWVRAVVKGREQEPSPRATLPANAPVRQFIPIKLQGDYTVSKLAIADLDGDGKLDFIVKQPGNSIDPGEGYWRRSPGTYKIEAYRSDGTLLWSKDLGWNIEQGIWYSPMVAFDLDGDGKAELALKTAPTDTDLRDADGHVLTGPEYCSVLDGMTGKEIARVDWIARGNVADWGDKTGNRASRHAIGTAYLDGARASLLVHRGTYTTMRVDAYNLIDRQLKKLWSWNGDDENPRVRGQGMHGMKAGDLDGDGRDEVLIGAAALDDNGKLLWNTGLGHPDVCYIADIDPAHPGLEIAYGIEPKRGENGIAVVDACTGQILWGAKHPTTHVHDQGMVADIDPNVPGLEIYGAEADGSKFWLYSACGELLGSSDMGGNSPHALYWDDGPAKAYIPGPSRFRRPVAGPGSRLMTPRMAPQAASSVTAKIMKYKGPQIGEITGRIVGLADVIGDWREEIITSVEGELRVYSTTIPATSRRVTLMQDRLYRNDVAQESMGYFFPPQLGGKLF